MKRVSHVFLAFKFCLFSRNLNWKIKVCGFASRSNNRIPLRSFLPLCCLLHISYLRFSSINAVTRQNNEPRPNYSQKFMVKGWMSAACFNVEPLWSSLYCLFQVQTKQWACNRRGVTCNCGVVIRDHNDLISFSCCGNPPKVYRDDFTPMSVEIPRKKCLAPGITITQLIKGVNSKYEVFPCSLIILIYRWYWSQPKGLWKCVGVRIQPCRLKIPFCLLTEFVFRGHFQFNFFSPRIWKSSCLVAVDHLNQLTWSSLMKSVRLSEVFTRTVFGGNCIYKTCVENPWL